MAPDSQHACFVECALPLVDVVLSGHDATMIAFGQTGAGKTYTIIGAEGGRRRAAQDGMLPLAASEIFRRVARLEASAVTTTERYQLRASFIEIHREKCYDLLGARAPLKLREGTDGGAYAEGATRCLVLTVDALLDCVAHGAQQRVTAETGVHEHSSRSHAVLTLTLEKRWLASASAEGSASPRKALRQTSALRLVDLAGTEGMDRAFDGRADAAGVATNLGLLVLGRVIMGLAKRAPHVPFRDSTLTKLLRPSLEGSCRTCMLACVSPAAADATETARVLGYAKAASSLVCHSRARLEEYTDLSDPLAGDAEDSSELQRRTVWLEAAEYGDIFARVVGDARDPLVLYVHGSGPHNSSMHWNDVAIDLAERAAAGGRRFYHVAIDCPGYGRSPGDRQTIRSYPAALLSAVVRSCGKRRAALIVGSSQGSCACFNAVLDAPKLAERIAAFHPVGHAVERYSAIAQPTLLVFDTEDDGHPVTVGRRMRAALPQPIYREFTRSQHGEWDAAHASRLLAELLSMRPPFAPHRGRPLPELCRLAGGLRSWGEAHAGEWSPWWGRVTEGERPAAAPALREGVLQEVGQAAANEAARGSLRPKPLDECGGPWGRAAGAAPLFSDDEASDEDADDDAAEAAAAEQRADELAQTCCALHGGALGAAPIRLVGCRHALCASCARRTVCLFGECPVCDAAVQRRRRKLPSLPDADDGSVTAQPLGGLSVRASADANAAQAQMASALVLEYGSAATPCGRDAAGRKMSYTTFVRVVAGGTNAAIRRVGFNINPDYDQPTATLDRPSDPQRGFTFEYAMGRPYSCFIALEWAQGVELPPVLIEFRVQPEPRVARRLAFERPEAQAASKPSKPRARRRVTIEARTPRSAWVRRSGEVVFASAAGGMCAAEE